MHKALGRGLDALLKPVEAAAPGGEAVARISLDKIRPNRYQPRTDFAPEALSELADSIRSHGLAQPLLVSPSVVPGEYELVAGERRLRASKMAGLSDVPCVIRAVSDRERAELSLVENLQREDLNPLEEAEALRKVLNEFEVTQEELARALGKSRPALANKIRLLDLPEPLRRALRDGALSEGHARALLGVSDAARQEELGLRIAREKLTVRDVEKIVLDWQTASRSGRIRRAKHKSADVRHVEEELQKALGRRVEVHARGKKGWVKLSFYSLDDLQALIHQIKGKKK
jgi:ParB family transcriptional regulator, chromosome partitioning protein